MPDEKGLPHRLIEVVLFLGLAEIGVKEAVIADCDGEADKGDEEGIEEKVKVKVKRTMRVKLKRSCCCHHGSST